jgi:Domain of unknown function (DUF4160)
MPELSRFFGIIIRMYAEPFAPHHQDAAAVVGFDPVELISGALPTRQQRLVEAWAELHVEELRRDWELLQAGRRPEPIAPLQ